MSDDQQLTWDTERPCLGFSAGALTNGRYRPTLTSSLGHFLLRTEQSFGRRNSNLTILGIEFSPDGPVTYFPGSGDQVSILLSDDARFDLQLALYELAHETVHLLAPVRNTATPYLEEGVAVKFAMTVSEELALGCHVIDPEYVEALRLYDQLATCEPGAVMRIRDLEPEFTKITPALIRTVAPGLSPELAEQLCSPFPNRMLARVNAP